jgi:ABC-type multidrug transport system ATPase subunit
VIPVSHRNAPEFLLDISHLSKNYDDRDALHDLNLTLDGGRLVALVGHNGAGKSTLLSVVAGLIEPTEGTVLVGGHVAGTLPARALLSYAGDNPILYDDLSVWEHLEYVAALHGAADWQEPSRALLKRFELLERADDLPSKFSRGMRQKTALAVALVRPAALVVVDEPFVGLDMKAQAALLDVLAARATAGSTVVVATHQPLFLSRADWCVMLHNGKLTHDGPPNAEILAELQRGG